MKDTELAKSLVNVSPDENLPQANIIYPEDLKPEDIKGENKKALRKLMRVNTSELKPIKSKV